ncbi:hypothetical protein DPMN_087464 [Dreissena polymorpha]|uniref:Uncharacterized protein n=1 Tax=Dreissena polymorpha TaxID=45954 RepID=A0A9D4QVL9_DREPO|nr:hypothetical protein DPMN_087464 [Dreissena polymorpha]
MQKSTGESGDNVQLDVRSSFIFGAQKGTYVRQELFFQKGIPCTMSYVLLDCYFLEFKMKPTSPEA